MDALPVTIELVKETRINGDVIFSVELNGKYVSNTTVVGENNIEEARKIYESVKSGLVDKREIIQSETIQS